MTIQNDVLRTACRLAGGEYKLANHLRVRAGQLARWLKGDERPPTSVFAQCVDLLLFHERHLS